MAKSFLGVRASPGRIVYGSFELSNVNIPVVVAAGRKDGPTLVVHCAQHASEYSGSAMVGLLLAGLNLSAMRGTLVVLPLVHIPSITRLRLGELYPWYADELKQLEGSDKTNVNRCWPGKTDGTFNDRLTHALTFDLFARADGVLDYHSCRLCDPNFTSYMVGHQPSRELALAFGFVAVDEAPEGGQFGGQLHGEVPRAVDTAAILVEMSPTSGQTNWDAISQALRGAGNAMKHLGMIKGRPELPPVQVVYHRGTEGACLRASHLGFAVTYLPPGGPVRKGELIAEVRSLTDFAVLQRHVAPFDGGLGSAGPSKHHVVLPGEELATVQPGVEIIRNRLVQ